MKIPSAIKIFTAALVCVSFSLSAQKTPQKAQIVYNDVFTINMGNATSTTRKDMLHTIDILKHLDENSIIYFTKDAVVMRKKADEQWEEMPTETKNNKRSVTVPYLTAKKSQGKTIRNFTNRINEILATGDQNLLLVIPISQSPHLKLKNPAKGKMFFDPDTKSLCIFTGTEWWFWEI